MTVEKLKIRGRIVGGHPIRSEDKKNFQTKQSVINPETGKPVQQWRTELAVPKEEFLAQVWPHMVQEAATMFPVDPNTGMPRVNRDFSWKYVDGDSTDCPKGSKVAYNAREGYPGHYILTLKTEAFCPDCYVFTNGAYREVEEHQIKVGDYVVACVDIKVHANNDGGLYINPVGYELVQQGEAISSGGGGNPNEMFGDASTRTDGGFQGQLPSAGAVQPQSAPVQAGPSAPVATGMPTASAMPQAAVAPNAGMPPATTPAPAHDFVQNAVGNSPATTAAVMPQGAASTPQMATGPVGGATPSPTNQMPGMPLPR